MPDNTAANIGTISNQSGGAVNEAGGNVVYIKTDDAYMSKMLDVLMDISRDTSATGVIVSRLEARVDDLSRRGLDSRQIIDDHSRQLAIHEARFAGIEEKIAEILAKMAEILKAISGPKKRKGSEWE